MMMLLLQKLWYCLALLLGSGVINQTGATPNSHNSNVDTVSALTQSYPSYRQQCQRSTTYEEIRRLLAHSPFAMDLDNASDDSTSGARVKRDRDNSHVNALYAAISDHRTMINCLMNNTVNVTQFKEHFTEQHSRSGTIWKSWRDVSLVFLTIICLSMLMYLLVIRLQPLKLLTLFLLRRHQAKQQQVNVNQKKNSMVRGPPSDMELDNVSAIDRNYIRY